MLSFLLNQYKNCNHSYLLTILLFGFITNASTSDEKKSSKKNVIILAMKDALPFTIGGFAFSLANEYRIAKKLKEVPRLNKFRIGRSLALSTSASAYVVFMTYQYHKIKYEIPKIEN